MTLKIIVYNLLLWFNYKANANVVRVSNVAGLSAHYSQMDPTLAAYFEWENEATQN